MAYITLLNGVLNFGFPILFKKWGKKDETILRKKKKTEEKRKYCYHSDICRWKRDSFSNEVEITRGID